MIYDKSPRAVAVCSFMEKATDPVLGTSSTTEISPLPYGVGVYVVDPTNGLQRALPLYWVSPKVAIARGIKSAWYVCAEPNMSFTLKVSNVQPHVNGATEHVHGNPVGPSEKCGVEIWVDGANVSGKDRKYKMADPGKEREIRGFTFQRSFGHGNYDGKKSIRVFRFLKTETVEEGNRTVGIANAESIGKIQLRQFRGHLRSSPLIAATESCGDALTEAKPVEEKTAIKDGCSITVDRTGSVIQERSSRSTQYIQRPRDGGEIGQVTLLVREKRWLETRNIIDSEGNAFCKPPPPPERTRTALQERRKRKKVVDYVDLTGPTKRVKETIVIDD